MEKIIEPDEIQLEFAKRLPELILASSSPNRKALLEVGGCFVTVFSPNVDETRDDSKPIDTMIRIATSKLDSYLNSSSFSPDKVAIAADTLVFKAGKLLGKPKNIEEAKATLSFLSGSKQTVFSAVGLYNPHRESDVFVDSAEVIFNELGEKEIDAYLKTGEWQGAAGGYRLQSTGYTLIDSIIGDWTCVVGLPLKAILKKLS